MSQPPPPDRSPGRTAEGALRIPLAGRNEALSLAEAALERLAEGPRVIFCSGEAGAGKSRLCDEVARRAEALGWDVATGRAYPVERAVPYALFADAFAPMLRAMDPETLAVLSRGGESELACLFPALDPDASRAPPPGSDGPDEFRARLSWNFAELLGSLGGRGPLLVVLEDLHWADPSSLELLHFCARHSMGKPVLFLCTSTVEDRDRSPELVRVERSLVAGGVAVEHRLQPLTEGQVEALICEAFSTDPGAIGDFASRMYRWTGGNLFLLAETLEGLVASGAIRRRESRWGGWDTEHRSPPRSVRDAVLTRLLDLSSPARALVEVAAIAGGRIRHPVLSRIAELDEPSLLAALNELVSRGFLTERTEEDGVVYDFRHPAVRQTLYESLGLQQTRVLHARAADALETLWGDEALQHADELAYHFARCEAGSRDRKAAVYLAEAGRRALARHADRAALDYLDAALERAAALAGGEGDATRRTLMEERARAQMRLGAYESAAAAWSDTLAALEPGTARHAGVSRRLGLATFWCGRHREALDLLGAGLDSAARANDERAAVELRLARAYCLQELGRAEEARAELAAALPTAEEVGDVGLLARVHRSLALLHVWIGPPETAVRHADQAARLAEGSGDLAVAFWVQWGMGVLNGMRGDTGEMAARIDAAQGIADRLRSPVLGLWTAELSVELAHAEGDWDAGIARGEASIELARNLHQLALLPRLLVWTSLFHVGRGDLERASELIDEACSVSGMHDDGPLDVHKVVPAYTGLAHYRLALGDYDEAIEAARDGLRIAEGTGYTLWAMHRLMPILAEACLWAGRITEAEEIGRTLRAHATRLDHRLGLAWADACDALVRWKKGDPHAGALAMREAAEALERIPLVPDAARIRRQLAGRLAEIGETEAALEELRRVHAVLERLGARLELQKARAQFREVGSRPPPRGGGRGPGGMTGRELEIARLVAHRKSNKAIGKELGISPRTVSTHLSNIFKKLDVSSRAQLGDYVREEIGLGD